MQKAALILGIMLFWILNNCPGKIVIIWQYLVYLLAVARLKNLLWWPTYTWMFGSAFAAQLLYLLLRTFHKGNLYFILYTYKLIEIFKGAYDGWMDVVLHLWKYWLTSGIHLLCGLVINSHKNYYLLGNRFLRYRVLRTYGSAAMEIFYDNYHFLILLNL